VAFKQSLGRLRLRLMKEYYVYIMSSASGILYTGITNNLEHRIFQHKNKLVEGFTKRYNVTKLVYFDSSDDVTSAIAREKQIKGMLRIKKIALIKTQNPDMKDLSEGWFDTEKDAAARP
jgi:putative endonuclease